MILRKIGQDVIMKYPESESLLCSKVVSFKATRSTFSGESAPVNTCPERLYRRPNTTPIIRMIIPITIAPIIPIIQIVSNPVVVKAALLACSAVVDESDRTEGSEVDASDDFLKMASVTDLVLTSENSEVAAGIFADIGDVFGVTFDELVATSVVAVDVSVDLVINIDLLVDIVDVGLLVNCM